MTFEKLKEKLVLLDEEKKRIEHEIVRVYDKKKNLQLKYIRELLPFEIRKWQRVTIRLMVTAESRKLMTDYQRRLKKNQEGYVYCVTGCVIEWIVGDEGEARPCFYGDVWYNRYDKILDIELAEQVDGHCSKCLKYKDGLCYMMGGKDISKNCATHEVGERDMTCPRYEEMTQLWDKQIEGRHYPNVTIVKHAKPVKYRIYSLNWDYFSEYSEKEIETYYKKER